VICKDDVSPEKRQQLIKDMTARDVHWLFRHDLIPLDEITEIKRQQFIEELTADNASRLVHYGLIHSEDVPEIKRQQLIAEISPKNAKWLFRHGLVRPENISAAKRKQLIDQMTVDNIIWLIKENLIQLKDIPEYTLQQIKSIERLPIQDHTNASRQIYSITDIQNDDRRWSIGKDIKNLYWDLVVIRLNQDGFSGFSSHNTFQGDIFFNKNRLFLEEGSPLKIGDILRAEIAIVLNRRCNEWNFAVKNGQRIQCTKLEIPPWWQAWKFLAPQWEKAAEGGYYPHADLFKRLQAQGFSTVRLRDWHPSDREGRRIKEVNHLVQLALNEPTENLPIRMEHIASQLAGDGVWSDIRQLVDAYLDFASILTAQAIAMRKVTAILKPIS
jgi:hypothetical protein